MSKNLSLPRLDHHFFVFFALAALVLYALFRSDPFPDYFLYSDKVGHFIAFLLLFAAVYWAFRESISIGFILIALLGLAIGSEYVQGSVLLPNRHFGISDILANVGGVFVGLVFMRLLVGSRQS